MKTLNPIPDLIRLFDAFCYARDVGDQRGSALAFGAGHRIESLRAGGNITVHSIGDAIQRMSDEWPPEHDHEWPRDIPRPKRRPKPRKFRRRRPEPALAR